VRSDPKHRQLARQVGGVSLIQVSSMAVTFLHKIVFRPGSKFCFGTISAVADEEGTLHRIADPTERRSSSKISVEIREKQKKAQPPMLRKRIASGRTEARGPPTRRTPFATSPTEEWTQITRKKETNKIGGKQVVLSAPPPSKENRKKIVTTATPFYPDVLFIGRAESPPISETSRLYPERNLLSGNPIDEGTDAKISGDITRLESGIRCSLCRETRPQKWEKPRKSVSSGKGGIPDDAIAGELKNRPNRKLSNVGKILSSGAT
jgi:hypothetical protein